MKNKYEKVRMKLINFMKLTILVAISVFGFAYSSYSQTLVTVPANGHYCEGGTGVEICVENTVNGVNYYVMHNGDTVNCIIGDGGTVCCSGFTDPGDYTTLPPTNTVTVYVDPLPIQPTIVGEMYLCEYYNYTTYFTYENVPTDDYFYTWQAFGYVNSGSLQGFFAFSYENSLQVNWGNADWGTLQVSVRDVETGCIISSDIYTVNICQPITNNIILDDISICHNTSACFTGSVPQGGCDSFEYLWQRSTDGINWEAAWCCNPSSNNSAEEYCTPDLEGPATYYLRRIVTGLACESISNVVTLTVYAEFIVEDLEQPDPICYNTEPDCIGPVMASGGDGNYTYKWFESADNSTFIEIAGETGDTYCPPALLADMYYYCEVTNYCGVLNTNTVYQMVYDEFLLEPLPQPDPICYNTLPSCIGPVVASGGDGSYTYKWFESPDNTTFTEIAGETGSTYCPPVLMADMYYYCEVTNVCGVLNTNTVYQMVYDEFLVEDLEQPDPICYNTVPDCIGPVMASGGDGNYTYKWFESADNSTFTEIAGETGDTYCPPALMADMYYYCEVTNYCGVLNTNTVYQEVWDEFDPGTIGFQPDPCNVDSVAICDGDTPPCIAFCDAPSGGEPGVYTYQWLVSDNGVDFTPITGEVGETYCPPALYEHTYYKCQVTNPCDEGVTNMVKVHVWDPFVAGDIGFDPTCENADTVCYNTAPACVIECASAMGGNTVDGYTYKWFGSTDGTNFAEISGETGSGFCPPALTEDYWYYRWDMNECGEYSTDTVYVKVWGDLYGGTIGDDETICHDTAPDELYFITTPTGGECDGVPACYTYQWQESVNCTGTWTDIASATAATYQPPALTDTTCYRVLVTDSRCGFVYTANFVQINVWDPLDVGNIGFYPDCALADTACYNTAPACIDFCELPSGGEPGQYTYLWYFSLDENGPFNPVDPPETGSGYCPPALTQTTYYKCMVTNPCETSYTNVVTAFVWDEFFAGDIGFPNCVDSDTVCYNTAPDCIIECGSATGGNTLEGYTYKWFKSINGIDFEEILGETGAGYCPGAIIGDHWYYRWDMNECGEMSTDTLYVKVWEEFFAGDIGFDPSCDDETDTCYDTAPYCIIECGPATGGNIIDGYTYKWFESTDGITFAEISGETGSGYCPPVLTEDYWYYRWDMNECGEKSTDTVYVNVWDDLEAGTIGDDQTICNNTAPIELFFITTPTGGQCDGVPTCYTYQWQESINCTGIYTDITGATDATYQPPALIDTTCYRVVVTDYCGTVYTGPVQINVWDPLDVGNVGFDPDCALADTACYNTAPACIDFCELPSGGEPGQYEYLWYFSLDENGPFNPVVPQEINPEFCPPALLETTYYKCQVTNPCETGFTNIVTAFVWDEFEAGTIVEDQVICYNTVPECLEFSTPPSGGNTINGYTYQWYNSSGSISGATNATYCPPALLMTETFYCEVTNDPCGVLNTDTITITVYDEFMAGSVGFDPDPCHEFTVTICSDDTPPLIDVCTNPTGGDGIYTYQWQVDTLCMGNWVDIAGATGATYQPGPLNNPDLTDTYTKEYCFRRYDMNDCDSIYTNSVQVIVNPLPIPFEIIGEEMVCAGDIEQYCVYPIGVDDPYTYSWSVTGGILDPDNCCDTCAVIEWGLGPDGWITITKENTNTGCTITTTLYVQINPIPNPVITGPIVVDEGEVAVYSVPLLPNQIYSWFITGGIIQSGGGTNEITVEWGPAGLGHILVSQKDNNYPATGCCGVAEMDVTILPVGAPTISGTVTYNNAYNTPLNGVTVDLRNEYGVVINSDITHFDFDNGLGFYEFYNVPDGNYTLDVYTDLAFGGVNATDALAIKFHAISQPGFILTGLPLVAADVNASSTVNATDALYVVYRTINYISDFPAGDWAFDNGPLTVSGVPITNNILAECFGDVNMSYIPTGYKSTYNYNLLTDGVMYIEPDSEFELPVSIDRETIMGAMTLNLTYSDDLVEVVDITVQDNDNMLYTIEDGMMRIAWANTEALQMNTDDVVVTLKLKALADITSDNQLIALSSGTEFADASANAINDLSLKTTHIETSSSIGGSALSHNYPNPFMEYTDIEYTIPEAGKVVITVYDILGNKITTLVNASQDAGTHTTRFLVNDNNPGVYIYELQVEGLTSNYSILRKMVIK